MLKSIFAFHLSILLVLILPASATALTKSCALEGRTETMNQKIKLMIDEAKNQHKLFGSQTIERNGGMFRAGLHEAEWDKIDEQAVPTWKRVAAFWNALGPDYPFKLTTSKGSVARNSIVFKEEEALPVNVEKSFIIRESLLRSALIDNAWSAAFISYLMKIALMEKHEFKFSSLHADYVLAALQTSQTELEGGVPTHMYRACDIKKTKPRAGDLICYTRNKDSNLNEDSFSTLRERIERYIAEGKNYRMHCDLVVRSDLGGDSKLESIGGNVFQSVTLRKMSLNAHKYLSATYQPSEIKNQQCGSEDESCVGNLSLKSWVVVLQFRN